MKELQTAIKLKKTTTKHLVWWLTPLLLLLHGGKIWAQHPNVIIIMTDDQGYGDIAAHGNPYILTPEMDKLYNQSLRLENFHVNPTCSPTRASLMTGKYAHRVGVWHTVLGRERVRASEVTMADIFKRSGYATGIFGKWHLGDDYPFRPSDRGFQESVIHKAGGVSQMVDYWDNDRMNDTYFHNNKPQQYEGYSADVFFDEAMKFISSNKKKQFFAYIATSAPHGPTNVMKAWADKYLQKGIDERVANFYASIERVDFNIGRLRKFLADAGMEENTILIFLTDNGTAVPNNHNSAGMKGHKGAVYEGGHRVPCFIHWPQKKLLGGTVFNGLTSVMDLLPTFIDLCGLHTKDSIQFDGHSLQRLLQKGSMQKTDRVVMEETQRIPHPVKWYRAALMTNRWRLINGRELYDMEADPKQKINVADKYPEVVKQLSQQYDSIWASVSAKDDEYQPLIFGSNKIRESLLTAQDWYWDNNNDKQELVFLQSTVREGKRSNGVWRVDIARKGKYTFHLRRYPRESKLALNASAPEVVSADNDILLTEGGEKPQGKVLNIEKAKLKINGFEREIAVDASREFAPFTVELDKGPAEIQTWFYTSEREELGAYYVNVYW